MDFYAELGKEYYYERSGNSIELHVNGLIYHSNTLETEKAKAKNKLPPEEVYFISRVKKYIVNNGLHKLIEPNYANQSDIKFFDYNRTIHDGDSFIHPYSIDIVKAYWYSGYLDGFLSDELFNDGLSMDKRIRLASLGSFAKRVDRYRFNGSEEKMIGTKEPRYPHIFFNQANTIYMIMDKCKRAVGSDFLFYWTDGIYVKTKEASDICSDIIIKHGFESEIKRLMSISRDSIQFVAKEYVVDKGKRGVKKSHYRVGLSYVKPVKVNR